MYNPAKRRFRSDVNNFDDTPDSDRPIYKAQKTKASQNPGNAPRLAMPPAIDFQPYSSSVWHMFNIKYANLPPSEKSKIVGDISTGIEDAVGVSFSLFLFLNLEF